MDVKPEEVEKEQTESELRAAEFKSRAKAADCKAKKQYYIGRWCDEEGKDMQRSRFVHWDVVHNVNRREKKRCRKEGLVKYDKRGNEVFYT